MYPEKKGGSHKMARPRQNWGLLTLLTRRASIWTMPNTASPKSEPPCGRAVYTPVRATILGYPPQKTAPGGFSTRRTRKNHNMKMTARALTQNDTMMTSELTHWSYCSLALSPRYIHSMTFWSETLCYQWGRVTDNSSLSILICWKFVKM